MIDIETDDIDYDRVKELENQRKFLLDVLKWRTQKWKIMLSKLIN